MESINAEWRAKWRQSFVEVMAVAVVLAAGFVAGYAVTKPSSPAVSPSIPTHQGTDGTDAPSNDPHVVWHQWPVGGMLLCVPPDVDCPDSSRCMQLPPGSMMSWPEESKDPEHDTTSI